MLLAFAVLNVLVSAQRLWVTGTLNKPKLHHEVEVMLLFATWKDDTQGDFIWLQQL